MGKIFLLALALVFLTTGGAAQAVSAKTTPKKTVLTAPAKRKAVSVKKIAIPKPKPIITARAGYFEAIKKAQKVYLAASKKAKAAKSKSALEQADQAYTKALEEAAKLLEG